MKRGQTLGRILPDAVAAAGLSLASVFPLNNVDTFGHLAQGRFIAEKGAVPDVDPFSVWRATPQDWRNYEWGSDLLFHLVFSAFGPNGLIAFKLVLLTIVAVLVVELAGRLADTEHQAVARTVASWLLVLALPVLRIRLTVRPHLCAFLFGATYLLLLHHVVACLCEDKTSARKLWPWFAAIVGIHVVWLNMHGSHLLGLVMVGATAVACFRTPAFRPLLGLATALVVASGVSPFGYSIATDAVEHVFNPAYRTLVTEWAPWSAKNSIFYPMFWIAWSGLLVMVVRPTWTKGAAGRAAVLIAVLLAAMALRSLRFFAIYYLLAVPVIAQGLSSMPRIVNAARRGPVLAALWCLAVASYFVVEPRVSGHERAHLSFGGGISYVGLPRAAALKLATDARPSIVLASAEDSWFLLFAVPNLRVIQDGRVPFYGADYLNDLAGRINDPKRLPQALEEYQVDAVVVRHTAPHLQALLENMRGLPSFKLTLVEDRHALFERAEIDAPSLSLPPSYDPEVLLSAGKDERRFSAELRVLEQFPNTLGYVAWARGMEALSSLLRDGARAGVRIAVDDDDRVAAIVALDYFETATGSIPNLPTVGSYHAMAALAACRLDEAERIVSDLAEEYGEFREVLLLSAEIARERGNTGPASALVSAGRRIARGKDDPWLDALTTTERSCKR